MKNPKLDSNFYTFVYIYNPCKDNLEDIEGSEWVLVDRIVMWNVEVGREAAGLRGDSQVK